MNPNSHLPPVPRLIFLTWKVRQFPQAVQRCVESFQRRNPHWTVVVMSDEDCLKWLAAKRPADLAWYEALPKGILRADAMRLLWLHEIGGIYADIDVECLRPLDGLVEMLGDGEWLALTRDHPVHERIHFQNTPTVGKTDSFKRWQLSTTCTVRASCWRFIPYSGRQTEDGAKPANCSRPTLLVASWGRRGCSSLSPSAGISLNTFVTTE